MSRRKLLLIAPIQWLAGKRKRGWSGTRALPPLSLGYVAALTPTDWEVRIVDENPGRFDPQSDGYRPDLVGVTSLTSTIPRAYELAATYRQQGIPVVIGGYHATALPDEVVRYADVAYVGQAEGAWPQVLDDAARGRLREVYDGGTPPLDRLPLPRRDLYPHRTYFDSVLTSKGCPYRCEFCSVWKTHKSRYQSRPVGEVLDELAQIPARYIFFVDDNLTVDRRRAIALCQGMVERGLKKRFAIQASLEIGTDDELLEWLHRAGCFFVLVGIESVEEETLTQSRKATNLRVGVARYGEAIANMQRHGMAVSASLIFGHDADTRETFCELEAFIAESGVDSPVYNILAPYPGTDLRARLAEEGRLVDLHLPGDYALFDAHHVTYRPLAVSADELLRAYREAVRRDTLGPVMVRGLWQTWRRTGSLLAALASFQNRRWARLDVDR